MSNVTDLRRRNFISADRKCALNSFDELFTIGELVGHQDDEAGTATIEGFDIDDHYAEVKVLTDKGYAHIDFIHKINL